MRNANASIVTVGVRLVLRQECLAQGERSWLETGGARAGALSRTSQTQFGYLAGDPMGVEKRDVTGEHDEAK